MVKAQLNHEIIDDQTYWFAGSLSASKDMTVYLLPNYDKYIVGYTERSVTFDTQHIDKLDSRGNVLFNNTIIVDGRIAGTWKRTLKKGSVVIEPNLFIPLNAAEQDALNLAAQRYGEFLNLSPVVNRLS